MKKCVFSFIVFVFTFSYPVLFAQHYTEITLLKKQLALLPDPGRADVCNQLANSYINDLQIDSGLIYGKKALEISRRLGQKRDQVEALMLISCAYTNPASHEEALTYAKQALDLAVTLNDQQAIAKCFLQVGQVHRLASQSGQAQEAYARALQAARASGDTTALMDALLARYFHERDLQSVRVASSWQELVSVARHRAFEVPVTFKRPIIISPSIEVLEDSSRSYTIDQVSSAAFASKFTANLTPLTGIHANAVYWLKFKIKGNRLADGEYTLNTGFWAKQQMFLPMTDSSGRRVFVEQHTGVYVPESRQEFKHPYYFFRVPLRQQTEQEVYIRLEKLTWGIPTLYVMIDHPEQMAVQMGFSRYANGIFQGILAIIALYSLIFGLLLREKLYLYYSLMIISLALGFMFQYQYMYNFFFSEYPILNRYLLIVAIIAALISLMVFSNRFLNSQVLLPYWRRYTQFVTVVLWLPLLGDLYHYYTVANHYPDNSLFTPYRMIGAVVFIGMIVQGILSARKGYKAAYYFLVANMALVVGGVAYALSTQGLLAAEWTRYLVQVGLIVQVCIFALGIAYRMRLMNEERQQAVEDNLRLQQEMNRDLEQKVLERTAEISQQKEEIEAQRDELQSKNKLIEEIHQNITASIHYAQRIQQALLPARLRFKNLLPGSFIFYRPKDIVCGDFYWCADVTNAEGRQLKIAIAADCTGHGVPGALMTVLCNSIFNSIILNKHITDPVEMLYETDRQLQALLQQQDAEIQSQDGMDLAMLIIDEQLGQVTYAGAKNPLYYVRDGQMNEIKAAKFSIGGSWLKMSKSFEAHTFAYHPGDVFYIFSDGFQDQFGGDYDKKYLSRRFREFLLRISKLSMEEQHERLAREFDDWKSWQSQTDDVLVMGIRL